MDRRSSIIISLAIIAILSLTPIQGAQKGQNFGVTPSTNSGTFFFADSTSATPGKVFESTYDGKETVYFSRSTGSLKSFVFNPANKDELYYIDTYSPRIFKSVQTSTGWSLESDYFTHNAQVRDIAFRNVGGVPRLFFSDAEGSQGRIYWIDGSGKAVLYHTVNRTNLPINAAGADVVENWAGDFTFDNNGVLYLSSGNQVPATIYRVDNVGIKLPDNFKDWRKLTPLPDKSNLGMSNLYTDQSEGVSGIAYRDGSIYFVSGQEIFRFDLSTMKKTHYLSLPGHSGLSDLGF